MLWRLKRLCFLLALFWGAALSALAPQTLFSGSPNWAFADLGHDAGGTTYLTFRYASTLSVKAFDGSAWSDVTAFNAASLGFYSLGEAFDTAVAGDGTLYLAFTGCSAISAETCHPYFMAYDGSWGTPQTVTPESGRVKSIHLQVDGAGVITLSYVMTGAARQDRLAYVTKAPDHAFSAPATVVTSLDSDLDEIPAHWLGMDTNGNTTLFYLRENSQNDSRGNLYMSRSTDGFSAQTLLVDGVSAPQTYLVNDAFVTPDGGYHVNYTALEPDGTAATLYYLSDTGGMATAEPVGDGSGIRQGRFAYGGSTLSMLVEQSGLDFQPQGLSVLRYESGAWVSESHSSVTDFTPGTAVYDAASTNGRVIVYQNTLINALKALTGSGGSGSFLPAIFYLLQ